VLAHNTNQFNIIVIFIKIVISETYFTVLSRPETRTKISGAAHKRAKSESGKAKGGWLF